MDTDFQIRLTAKFEESQIVAQLRKIESKLPTITLKAKFDEAALRSQLKQIGLNIGDIGGGTGGGTGGKTKVNEVTTSGFPSRSKSEFRQTILSNLASEGLGAENIQSIRFVEDINDASKAIQATVKFTDSLGQSMQRVYNIAESGAMEVDSGMIKMTHSTQEVGKYTAQNVQMYTDLSDKVKLLSDNQLISSEQADKFNQRLASARDTTDELAAKKSFQKIAKDINLAERNATKFAQLQSRLNKLLETKSINKSTYDDLNKSLAEANSRLNETEKSAGFKNVEQRIARANKQSSGFLSNLIGSVKQTAKFAVSWGLVNTAISLAVGIIKKVIAEVNQLDTAFTNIRMVTGGTKAETNALAQEYLTLAKTMGATITEVTSAANDWLRAGMSVEETNAGIKASLTLSKVGALDSAEATKILISTMRGYDLEASELMSIVDKLSAVDVAASVSTEDLGLALQKGAASARLAGISMDKYLGYVAAISEVTGESGDIIGNALKTIFSRAQTVKLGKTLTEDEEDVSNYFSDVDKAMAGIGINWAQATKNLTDLGAGLDMLAEKWRNVDEWQRRQIATAIAGRHQAERFLDLMEKYDKAKELEETSKNSEGSAQDKMNTWLESINSRMKQAAVQWSRLGQAFIDTGWADVLADFVVELSDLIALLLEFAVSMLGVMPIFQLVLEGINYIIDFFNKIFEVINYILKFVRNFSASLFGGKSRMWFATDMENILNDTSDKDYAGTDEKKKAKKEQEEYNKKLAEYNALIAAGKAELSSFAKELKKVIELRNEENKRLEQEKTIQEKTLAIEKAREELAEARQKRVLVYRLGKGFVYEEDFSAVQEAQEKLNEAIADFDETLDDINFEIVQEIYDTLANPPDDLVDNWEEYFKKWGSLEGTKYAYLLKKAKKFVKDYVEVMKTPEPEKPNTETDSKSVGAGSTAVVQSVFRGYGASFGGGNPFGAFGLKNQFYASGTTSASGGLSLVGEEGAELRVLNKGDGIIPANITKNLWELGKNPQKVGGSSTHISIGNISLPNVTDTDSFLMELNKIAVPTGGSLK